MKILFDQGVPAPLRSHLAGHDVTTAYECGWSDLSNGQLLDAAEQDGYELLITTDRNLKDQQDLSDRRLAILVLLSTSWPRIQQRIEDIQDSIEKIRPGDYVEVSI